MPSNSQYPGPKPPPTRPTPRKQRSRKAERDNTVPGNSTGLEGLGRAGSAGGILLPTPAMEKAKRQQKHEDAGKEEDKMSKTQTASTSTPTPPPVSKEAANGPNRQRRRPRKLNKEPTSTTAANTTATATATATTTPKDVQPASTDELEALKSRVRGLEAKVEDLYKSGAIDARTGRSPRRRGKGRKSSSTQQVPTLASTTPVDVDGAQIEELEEADEELVRLEGELEHARQDLAIARRARPRGSHASSNESDYIEEIPRDTPAVEEVMSTGDRQVTLTGNYRIPLPKSVKMEDVKSIQEGINSASNLARGFLEQRRANQAAQRAASPAPTPKPTPKRTATSSSSSGTKAKARASPASTAVSTEVATGEGKSWGQWFGGYSMAISRAVKNIEAEAAIESQKASAGAAPKRPATGTRSASTPSNKPATATKPTARAAAGGTSAKAARPKARASNVSSEQVKGLMS